MDLADFKKAFDALEIQLVELGKKSDEQLRLNGKVSEDTTREIKALGDVQHDHAKQLLEIQQRMDPLGGGSGEKAEDTAGQQFVKSDGYKAFLQRATKHVSIETKNTVVGSAVTVPSERRPGLVRGPFQSLELEPQFVNIPTTSNAIDYTRENVFTNNAAEVSEAAAKPESSITFEPKTMHVSTVAHWIRMSEQLASDNAALAAYIDLRMRYGVDLRVEMQLGAGNGVNPNLLGLMSSGQFTPHGYLAANVGSTLPKLVLIRKIIARLRTIGYVADTILMTANDWADIEIELMVTNSNAVRVSVDALGRPLLFGLPVVQVVGMPAGQFLVGALSQAATLHTRQGMTVELSKHDADNFTKNLLTLRAERRLALTVEVPAALIGGALVAPAS